MNRRRFTMSLAVLAGSTVLAACGASATPTAAPARPSASGSAAPSAAGASAAPASSAPSAAASAAATPATGVATPSAATPTRPVAAATPAIPVARIGGELTVYSARREELMKPLIDAFTAKTDVKVVLKSGAAGEMALLIEQERSSPRGDAFFTTDAASAEGLRQKGLLETYVSPNAAPIPAEFKAADGGWTGVIGRSRNIIYNTQAIKADDAPKSVFELTDPKYKGKLAMAAIREGGVRLWLASLVQLRGEAFTVKYINDLLANGMKVLPNHTETVQATVRGEYSLCLANHYYYVIERNKNVNVPLGLIYPDQGANDLGTLVIPLAVAAIKGAKNLPQAKAFVDFALSQDGQLPLTTQENEFPLTPGTPLGASAAPSVKTIDQIKRPVTDFTKLAEIEKRVVEVFTPLLSGN